MRSESPGGSNCIRSAPPVRCHLRQWRFAWASVKWKIRVRSHCSLGGPGFAKLTSYRGCALFPADSGCIGPFLFAILRATAAWCLPRLRADRHSEALRYNRYTAFRYALPRRFALRQSGLRLRSPSTWPTLTLYIRGNRPRPWRSRRSFFRLERSYNSDNQQAGPFGVRMVVQSRRHV